MALHTVGDEKNRGGASCLRLHPVADMGKDAPGHSRVVDDAGVGGAQPRTYASHRGSVTLT